MADLTVKAESDLGKILAEFEAKGKAIERHLPTIAEMLVGAVQDVFEAEGPGWQDLAESTKRQRRGSSYVILQDTGVLAASVAAQYGATYAEAVDGTTYGHFHAPDPQGRDWTDLGPFEAPLLEDVAALILGPF